MVGEGKNAGAVLGSTLLAVLFACAAGGMYATAETQAELDDYAKLTVQLVADAADNALPS